MTTFTFSTDGIRVATRDELSSNSITSGGNNDDLQHAVYVGLVGKCNCRGTGDAFCGHIGAVGVAYAGSFYEAAQWESTGDVSDIITDQIAYGWGAGGNAQP